MSLSELLIKLVGIAFTAVGVLLVFTSLGLVIFVPLTIGTPLISFFIGLLLTGAGIAIVRGGTIKL